jgi:hypothetical protein
MSWADPGRVRKGAGALRHICSLGPPFPLVPPPTGREGKWRIFGFANGGESMPGATLYSAWLTLVRVDVRLSGLMPKHERSHGGTRLVQPCNATGPTLQRSGHLLSPAWSRSATRLVSCSHPDGREVRGASATL